MDKLIIPATTTTPHISFDGNNGEFSISGRSFPENVFEFYAQVLAYLEEYTKHPRSATKLVFNLNYFNTASYKIIVKLLMALARIDREKTQVTIQWICQKGDITIVEKGEELREYIKLNFEIVYQ